MGRRVRLGEHGLQIPEFNCVDSGPQEDQQGLIVDVKSQTVQIACKVSGFKVADGNTWWYRITSASWNNAYYVCADPFYNDGATSGPLSGSPFVDQNVPNC